MEWQFSAHINEIGMFTLLQNLVWKYPRQLGRWAYSYKQKPIQVYIIMDFRVLQRFLLILRRWIDLTDGEFGMVMVHYNVVYEIHHFCSRCGCDLTKSLEHEFTTKWKQISIMMEDGSKLTIPLEVSEACAQSTCIIASEYTKQALWYMEMSEGWESRIFFFLLYCHLVKEDSVLWYF